MSWRLPRCGAPGASPCSPAGSVGAEPRSRGPNARVSLVAALASLLGGISLLAFAAAPASADVLVSNIGQAQAQSSNGSFYSTHAQEFTTGSNADGYTLTSIEMSLRGTYTSQQIAALTAELWSASSGNPNEKVADLTTPSSLSSGIATFAAPNGTTLTANTNYFVVLYSSVGHANRPHVTLSNNQDSGAATGWSIGDFARTASNVRNPVGATWTSKARSLLIRVNGAVKQAVVSTPAAPTNLRVSSGDGSLVVSWTAPSGTLTGYDLHYTSANAATVTNTAAASGNDASAAWVVGSTSISGAFTTYTQSSLTNGTAYRVRLRAKNSGGNGAWAFTTGTPNIVLNWPGDSLIYAEGATAATIGLSGAATVSSAVSGTLTYTAGATNPASLSADLTTGYATTFSAAANSEVDVTLATLVNDTVNEEHETFTITINAGTGYVVGTPATTTVTITDNDPPAAPSGLSLTAGSGKLSASWTKPAGPVTGYQLRYKQTTATDQTATTAGDPSTGWVTSTASITTTSGEVTGLTNGTAYHVQVRATDGQTQTGNGYGAWSASRSGTPAASNKTITLSASSTTVTEGSPVTITITTGEAVPSSLQFDLAVGYTVTLGSAESDDTEVGAGSVFVARGGTTKTFEIPTRRDQDTDDDTFTVSLGTPPTGWTNGSPSSATITIEEDEPSGLTVTPGDLKLDLSWTAAASNANGYDVDYTSAPATGAGSVANDADATGNDPAMGWVGVTRSGATASQSITGLSGGTLYRVRVRALDGATPGVWLFGTGTPTTPPRRPPTWW